MERIAGLHGLRGALAVWVVVVHLLPAASIEPSELGPLAPLFGELIRVKIFCIMSGFVIFMMMAKIKESYVTYLSRRLRRIYPVYLVAFIASIAMSGIAYEALQNTRFESEINASRLKLLDESFAYWHAHIASHLTLLHGIIPPSILPSSAYAFLGQAWNISTEVQFYIVAPILFAGLHQTDVRRRIAFILGVGVIWALLLLWPNRAALSHFALFFAVGIASYYLWQRNWSDRRYFNPATVLAAAAIAGLIDFAFSGWIFVFGFALLVRDQARKPDPVTNFLSTPAMLFLGSISYPLYLLHMVPLYGWMYVLSGFEMSQAGYAVLLSVLTFATAIPLSSLVSRYVENAFYQSRTSRPQQPVPVQAPAIVGPAVQPAKEAGA